MHLENACLFSRSRAENGRFPFLLQKGKASTLCGVSRENDREKKTKKNACPLPASKSQVIRFRTGDTGEKLVRSSLEKTTTSPIAGGWFFWTLVPSKCAGSVPIEGSWRGIWWEHLQASSERSTDMFVGIPASISGGQVQTILSLLSPVRLSQHVARNLSNVRCVMSRGLTKRKRGNLESLLLVLAVVSADWVG